MAEKQEWIVGIHAVVEMLIQQPAAVQKILLQQGRDDARHNRIRELSGQARVPIQEAPRHELNKLSNATHQGVAAQCMIHDPTQPESFLTELLNTIDHPPLFLVLDGVTDPHNLGACLRTADAAGVDAVIVPKDKSASINTTVRKVASGAVETVKFVAVTNLQRCLLALKEKGLWLVGTAGESEKPVFDQDLNGPLVIVMGSEGKGLRRLTSETCDFLVNIPMAGAISSLNVSVATGVVLFEAVRQRKSS